MVFHVLKCFRENHLGAKSIYLQINCQTCVTIEDTFNFQLPVIIGTIHLYFLVNLFEIQLLKTFNETIKKLSKKYFSFTEF